MLLNAVYHVVLEAVLTIEKMVLVRLRLRSSAAVGARSAAAASAWAAEVSPGDESERDRVAARRDCTKATPLFSSGESVGKCIDTPIQFVFYHTLYIYVILHMKRFRQRKVTTC